MKVFSSARLRLSLWYAVALTTLSLIFSLGIYRIQTFELAHFEQAQRMRVQLQLEQGGFPNRGRLFQLVVDEELIAETKRRLLFSLGVLNTLVFVAAGGLGYVLAGRTLAPIEQMVEKQHDFISDASHELKTPLTSLRTSLEVFLRGKKRSLSEARDLLADNLTEVKRLQRLTESLLTLSRPEANRLDYQKVVLAECIGDAVKRVSPLAKAKNIRFTSRLAKGTIRGDRDQLTETFTILLDNAIKYTPQKGKIALNSKRNKKSLKVTVQDTGIGIGAKDLPHIFDRFYRADSARSRGGESGLPAVEGLPAEAGGYGLGLSIAKQIVESHRGTIGVTSKSGQGATFTLTFPLA